MPGGQPAPRVEAAGLPSEPPCAGKPSPGQKQWIRAKSGGDKLDKSLYLIIYPILQDVVQDGLHVLSKQGTHVFQVEKGTSVDCHNYVTCPIKK
jgi:hypothetical protein